MTIVPRKSDIFEMNSQSVPVENLIDVHPDRSLPRLFKYRGFDENRQEKERKSRRIRNRALVHTLK